MKKLLTILMLLAASLPLWAGTFVVNGINYVTTGEGTVAVTNLRFFQKYSGAIVIPSTVTYNGTTYNVTSIDGGAFRECTDLTSVTIPNSVTSIGEQAFANCTSLKTLDISENIESLGGNYLYGNQQDLTIVMRSLNPPMHVDPYEGFDKSGWTLEIYAEALPLYKEKGWIGEYKLSHFNFESDGICYDAISNSKVRVISNANKYSGAVVIPSSVEYDGTTYSVIEINESAFKDCTRLTSITIPNSVTSIGNSAFDNCTLLKEVKMEDGDETLSLGYNYYNSRGTGEGLFYDCPLKSLYLGRNLKYAEDRIYGYSPFCWIETLKEITIGSSVTSIGNYTFVGCTGLTSITIPNSVTSIGICAFFDCTSIKEVKMEDGDATLSLGYNGDSEGLFYDCPLESLYLGRNISYNAGKDYGYSPFCYINTLKEITIGNSVTSIGNHAFEGCTGLTSITIPNSVTSIGNYAFYCCSGLTSINLPNSVTSIGICAFYHSKFSNIYVNDIAIICNGVWSALPRASAVNLYLNGELVTELVIPDSITAIGNNTFQNCTGLTSVTIPNSVTSIGNYTFAGCAGLTSITIPNSVTSIGGGAFSGCTGLTEFTIPDGVTSIACFSGCTGLTSITLGNGVTSIGNSAFEGCTGLTSITIPNSVTSIDNNAFKGCTGLTSITIPNSVTSIGEYAFGGCTGLTSITLGNGVTSIGNSVFDNCTSLKEVKMEDGDATLSLGCNNYDYYNGQGLFYDCPLESLYLGRNLSYDKGNSGFSPFYNIKTLKEITIGNNVTSIGENAFAECSGLTSITIPNSVTSIGDFAFYHSTELTSVTIGSSVTSIGNYAFSGCSGLTSITIPNSVTSIGDYAFNGCSNIIVINAHPTTPPTIGDNTFEYTVKQTAMLNVSSLSAYTTADGWKDFANIREFAIEGYYDFEVDDIYYRIVSLGDKTVEVVAKDENYNSYSGDVVIPEIVFFKNSNFTVVSIGQAAFLNCNELLSLTIPQHVEEIKADALKGCGALKTLTIADSDKTLKTNQNFKGLSIESLYLGRDYEGDFRAYKSLQNVEISNKVTTLNEYSFDGCTSLTQLVLPESLKTIESYALSKTGIKELLIPAAVSEIKDNACSNSKISKLIIEGNNVIFSNNAFSKCPLTHIYLKETIKDGSFDGYKNLKTVVIGGDLDDVKKHDDTFINCNIDELIIDCEKVYCLFSNCNISKLHFSNNLSEWCNDGFDNRNDFIEISFGNDVTQIRNFINTGCSNLKTVKFGNKVESILANFGNSLEAMSVYSYNTTPPALEHAFANKTYMQGTLYVPKGCKDVYLAADGWKDFWNVEEISSITDNNLSYNLLDDNTLALIPDATGDIYSGQVVIPATVEVDGEVYKVSTIEANAFDNAYGVTSVIIEDSKEPLTIGEREEEITDNNYRVLLSDCKLDSVYVGRELTYQIKEIETPKYVLYNNSPFTNNAYLSKVTVGPEVATMGGAMFYGCRNIRNVYATGMIPPLEAEFETQVYEKATLTIPKGTLEAYTTTAGWEEFLNIVEEKVFSDIIENVNQPNTPVVVVSNGELNVMNGSASEIAVYNMSGNLIYRGVNRPVRIDIHGVYIVIVDGIAAKVVI